MNQVRVIAEYCNIDDFRVLLGDNITTSNIIM